MVLGTYEIVDVNRGTLGTYVFQPGRTCAKV